MCGKQCTVSNARHVRQCGRTRLARRVRPFCLHVSACGPRLGLCAWRFWRYGSSAPCAGEGVGGADRPLVASRPSRAPKSSCDGQNYRLGEDLPCRVAPTHPRDSFFNLARRKSAGNGFVSFLRYAWVSVGRIPNLLTTEKFVHQKRFFMREPLCTIILMRKPQLRYAPNAHGVTFPRYVSLSNGAPLLARQPLPSVCAYLI